MACRRISSRPMSMKARAMRAVAAGSWYTGAAARMLSAAYAMLGLEFVDGELRPRADAFDPKGDLRLECVSWRGKVFTAKNRRGA